MRSKKRLRVKNAVKQMQSDMDKYFHLVWYARNCDKRKHLENENYETMGTLQVIQNKFPEDVAKIGKDDNWNHGFNSGMLAASRLYLEMIEGDPEFALECHPDLDS